MNFIMHMRRAHEHDSPTNQHNVVNMCSHTRSPYADREMCTGGENMDEASHEQEHVPDAGGL